MVRNYKKKKGESAYNEEDIQASSRTVSDQQMTLREAAAYYRMSHTALHYRLKKLKFNDEGQVTSSVKSKYSSWQIFTKDQELSLGLSMLLTHPKCATV